MEKATVGPSGGSPSTWPFYSQVHSILGSFKTNNVEKVVFDSILDTEVGNRYENYEVLLEECSDGDSPSSPSSSFLLSSTPVHQEKRKRNNVSSEDYPDYEESAESQLSFSSTSGAFAQKKKVKYNFQKELLKKIDNMEANIAEHNKDSKDMEQKSYELDLKKTNLMERFVIAAEICSEAVTSLSKKS